MNARCSVSTVDWRTSNTSFVSSLPKRTPKHFSWNSVNSCSFNRLSRSSSQSRKMRLTAFSKPGVTVCVARQTSNNGVG